MDEKPTQTSGAERRTAERRALWSTATLLLPGDQTFPVKTFDISVGGVGVFAPANAPPGARLAIRLTLPQRPLAPTVFNVTVRVAHSVLARDAHEFKIGLQFVELDPKAESAIRHYIAYAG